MCAQTSRPRPGLRVTHSGQPKRHSQARFCRSCLHCKFSSWGISVSDRIDIHIFPCQWQDLALCYGLSCPQFYEISRSDFACAVFGIAPDDERHAEILECLSSPPFAFASAPTIRWSFLFSQYTHYSVLDVWKPDDLGTRLNQRRGPHGSAVRDETRWSRTQTFR